MTKNRYLLMILFIATLYATAAYGYREVTRDELGELKNFPERFTGQRLLVKDKCTGKINEPSFVAKNEGFSENAYVCMRLRSSWLLCLVKKNPQNERTLLGLDTMSRVTVKGVMIRRRGRRLGRMKATDNYFFVVDELVEGWPTPETAKKDWKKEEYGTVSLKDLNLDADKYLDQPLQLKARVTLAQKARIMSRCEEDIGISADDCLNLLVIHSGFIRFFLPKKDDCLQKIKEVSFGDVTEKHKPVVYLLRGELKKCGNEMGSSHIYYFIIRDLEKPSDETSGAGKHQGQS